MAQMKLEIGGRSFSITCQDGEEAHLTQLGNIVSEKASEAGDSASLTESRMLLFTSLLLADELHGIKNSAPASITEKPSEAQLAREEQAAVALEKLAERAESIANGLE